jgi:hypothetical protein
MLSKVKRKIQNADGKVGATVLQVMTNDIVNHVLKEHGVLVDSSRVGRISFEHEISYTVGRKGWFEIIVKGEL